MPAGGRASDPVLLRGSESDSLRLRSDIVTMFTLHMTLFTGNTCYLDINGAATLEDAGLYKCVLADQVDMQTVPRTIETLVRV